MNRAAIRAGDVRAGDSRQGDWTAAATLGFSGRAEGNLSLVVAPTQDAATARAQLLARVGAGPEDAVFLEQVHGARVAHVTARDAGRGARQHGDALPGVDAAVTRATGVALVVLAADCVPVLLVDPGVAVGAAHAGRAGVEAGVVPAVVAALGDEPARVTAVVGPAIGGCCYEVPAAVADRVAERVPAARAHTSWGTPSLDLPGAVAAQLAAAGVGDVRRGGGCTRCRSDLWFSHRATAAGAPAGRHAGVVVRHDAPAGSPPAAFLDLQP